VCCKNAKPISFFKKGSGVPPKRSVDEIHPRLEMTAFGQTLNLPLTPTQNLAPTL
jgi:hypothetical protein